MINTGTSHHHWNYYLAIENDLEKVSRYIEFNSDNLNTYSIELAHILLSASSEIDVILKQICSLISENPANNINNYREIIKTNLQDLIDESVYTSRFGLDFKPWLNWTEEDSNPNFWRSYNNVKHNRGNYFNEANLQNTLNAVGALLICVIYFYKLKFNHEKLLGNEINISINKTTEILKPQSNLLRLDNKYYQHPTYIY